MTNKTSETMVCKNCGFGQIAQDEDDNWVCPVCESREFVKAPKKVWKCVECGRTSEKPRLVIDADKGLHYDGCRGWD